MAEAPHKIGEIVIDRLGRGFKVTTAIFKPGEDRPRVIGVDHFPDEATARRFLAGAAATFPPFAVIDNTGARRNA